jgi:hypothetical protein
MTDAQDIPPMRRDILEWLRDEATGLDYAEFMTETSDGKRRRLLNHRRRLTDAADEIERLRRSPLRAERDAVLEEAAKVAEGKKPIMHGNFFKGQRDQSDKIAAAIRALKAEGVEAGPPSA